MSLVKITDDEAFLGGVVIDDDKVAIDVEQGESCGNKT